ncbi:hypothetical protein [Chitinophaga sancti]|uniref:hypothetical protein n=1 Tax=Chitinophaga sancti TaxID=1004 RepID=UPI003F798284
MGRLDFQDELRYPYLSPFNNKMCLVSFAMNEVHMFPIGIQGGFSDEVKEREYSRFQRAIDGLKIGETRSVNNWNILTGALNSGTLGNFFVTINGTLTGVSNEDGSVGWKFEGSLQMNDFWDFDPDPNGTRRPPLAERLVRIANRYLKGTPFWIHSVPMNVSQTSSQPTFNNSVTPTVISNRVGSGVSDESKTGEVSGSLKPQ